MSHRKRGLMNVVAVVVGLLLAEGPVAGIFYLGDRAANCSAVAAGGGAHVLTLSGAAAADSTLILFAATSGDATAAAVPMVDTRGNTWTLDLRHLGAPGSELSIFSARVAAGHELVAGDTVSISYSAAPPGGQTSCAVLSVFGGIQDVPRTDLEVGASGNSQNPSIGPAGPTSSAEELLLGSFMTSAATGGFSTGANFQPISATCSTPYCLIPEYRLLSSVGSYSAAINTGNVVPWTGILISYLPDLQIFSDGFESGSTGNWSTTVP